MCRKEGNKQLGNVKYKFTQILKISCHSSSQMPRLGHSSGCCEGIQPPRFFKPPESEQSALGVPILGLSSHSVGVQILYLAPLPENCSQAAQCLALGNSGHCSGLCSSLNTSSSRTAAVWIFWVHIFSLSGMCSTCCTQTLHRILKCKCFFFNSMRNMDYIQHSKQTS